MRFNFFDWIREGVKQSVLLGISDASEHIGTTTEVDQLNEHFLSTFQGNRAVADQSGAKGGARARRKALGRSLETIMEEKKETYASFPAISSIVMTR